MRELEQRLRTDLRQIGDFSRVHPLPESGQDVPDDLDARLVMLGIDHPYSKEPGNPAERAARAILESRGAAPRLYRNTLVFLAVDKTRLQELDEAVRRSLAWESILTEKETLDLSPHQVKQAEAQRATADSVVTARLPEAYQWLLVPGQQTPQSPVEWQAIRLSGQDALAVRAGKRCRLVELLVTGFGSTRLRMELDRVPLWRGNHVSIKQLVEDFARYLYLPRLKDPAVLLNAITDGLALLTWEKDSFAFAEGYDEAGGRYQGLRCNQRVHIADSDAPGLLVRPDVARKQLDAERPEPAGAQQRGEPGRPAGQPGIEPPPPPPPPPQPARYHGSVTLDPARVGRDASRIADEVISHLAGLVGAKLTVTLEIEAEIPAGAPENVVRVVTENSRTLKVRNYGFEED